MSIMTEHSNVITPHTTASNQSEQATKALLKSESNGDSSLEDADSSSLADSPLTNGNHSIAEDGQQLAHHDLANRDQQNQEPIDDQTTSYDTKIESVYDAVVGANDQELAKRQYVDDDADDNDDQMLPRNKRLATETSVAVLSNDNYASNEDGLGYPSSADTRRCHADGIDQISTGAAIGSPDQSNSMSNFSDVKHSDEPEQLRKLFIGGLDYKTSEETLKRHFEKFGAVIDCVVMREPQTRRSRGFGFVIYANSSMVDKAQLARPHELDGREVQSKRAISREDSGKPEAQATVKKVYLGGLSDDIEELELRDYFEEFGNIVNINIVVHRDTGKRRGFAFVEYDDYDPVDKIVLKKYHLIRDKRVEAKKAIPKVEMDARKRADPRAAMASAMIAMSGALPPSIDGPGRGSRVSGRGTGGLVGQNHAWDSPYGAISHQSYSSSSIDGYPLHYHSPSPHYNAHWMMHCNNAGLAVTNGPHGFRGSHGGGSSYGRSSHPALGSVAGPDGWTDYRAFPELSSQVVGGLGPARPSYQQHRGYRPYAANGGVGSYGVGGSKGPNPTRRSFNP